MKSAQSCKLMLSVILLGGALFFAGTVEARPSMSRAPTKAITKAVQSNIRQAVKPSFAIHSRYAKKMAIACFSLDGRWLVTANEHGTVYVWNVATGQQEVVFQTDRSTVSSLCFLTGQNVMAVGTSRGSLFAFDLSRYNRIHQTNAHNDKVVAIASNAAGNLITVGGNGRVKQWHWQSGQLQADMSTGVQPVSAAVRPGGDLLALGLFDGRVVLWDLLTGNFVRELHCGSTVRCLDFSTDGKVVCGLDNGEVQEWHIATGSKLMVKKGHVGPVLHLDVSAVGPYVVTGGADKTVQVSPLASNQTTVLQGHDGQVNSVCFSSNGRFVVSASVDRTARIWQQEQHVEAARLVSMRQGWAVVSPNGSFDGTLDGAVEDRLDAVRWAVADRVLAVDGFLEQYYRPALLGKILAEVEIKDQQLRPFIAKGFLMPPQVKFAGNDSGDKTSEKFLTVAVEATDAGGGIDEIRLYHNGKIVDTSDARESVAAIKDQLVKTVTYQVLLTEGENTFKAVALSQDRIESEAVEKSIVRESKIEPVLPVLHLLAVGINRYKNSDLDLNFAVPDAKGFTAYFGDKQSQLFRDVKKYELYDQDASLAKISTTMEILHNVPPGDVVIIYIAGHGDILRDRWYFVPYELVNPENDDALWNNGLSSATLQLMVARIGARRIFLLLDSCKSGAVLDAFEEFDYQRSFAVLSRAAGIHIGTSTTRAQYAGELASLGHGMFTYVLLDGLGGKADVRPADGNVSVRELLQFVKHGLPKLVEKYNIPAQQPTINSRGNNFPLVGNRL